MWEHSRDVLQSQCQLAKALKRGGQGAGAQRRGGQARGGARHRAAGAPGLGRQGHRRAGRAGARGRERRPAAAAGGRRRVAVPPRSLRLALSLPGCCRLPGPDQCTAWRAGSSRGVRARQSAEEFCSHWQAHGLWQARGGGGAQRRAAAMSSRSDRGAYMFHVYVATPQCLCWRQSLLRCLAKV